MYHYQYYKSQKWQSVVLTVKNENNQWNKSELDSRYLEYECNNRIGDLLSLLPFCKKSIVVCLINQRYEVFYLDKVCYLVFYIGIILSRQLYWLYAEVRIFLSIENYREEICFQNKF